MPNNIILTGMPKSGKSTMLEKIVNGIINKRGFLTKEVLDKEGKRRGFEIVCDDGEKQMLADIDFNPEYKVSKYGVDVHNFDLLIAKFYRFMSNQFLYIDEIGEMESFSPRFRQVVEIYLKAHNPFISTMTAVYNDEFLYNIRKRNDIVLIEINRENWDGKYKEVAELVKRLN